MLIFLVELIVTLVILVFFREALGRALGGFAIQGSTFLQRALSISWVVATSLGWDRFEKRWSQLQSDREKLFAVAVSGVSWWLYGVFVLSAVALLVSLGIYNLKGDFFDEAAFVMGGYSVLSLIVCLAVGFIPALLSKKPFAGFVLVGLLTPAFYLSLPGAIFLIAGDMLGVYLRSKPTKVNLIRAVCTLAALLLFYVAGPLLKPLTESWLQVVHLRWAGIILYWAIFSASDLIISMIVFHFCNNRVRLA